jgi:polysaccharide export outer membrane protein
MIHRSFSGLTALFVVAGWIVLFPAPAAAQVDSDFIAFPRNFVDMSGRNTKNPRQLPFNRMPGLSADYEVGPGDELDITIVGDAPQSFSLKISGAGEITVPLIGPITVAGMTAEQVEIAVAEGLKARKLINNPEVLVFISAYEAKTIYALGEVDRPGEYGVSYQTRLADLIFMAGGLDFTAARYGFLHRRVSNTAPEWRPTFVSANQAELARAPDQARPGFEVIRVDLQPLKEGRTFEQNIVLRNGDVFYAPRRSIDVIYVIGDVGNAGAFEMPEEKRLTALQAISWAGGPTKTAKMSRGVLVRFEGGQRQEKAVDFEAMLRGATPDIEVRPNDVIFIPGSEAKTMGYGILATVPRILFGLAIF